jgi:hypothetical protein
MIGRRLRRRSLVLANYESFRIYWSINRRRSGLIFLTATRLLFDDIVDHREDEGEDKSYREVHH